MIEKGTHVVEQIWAGWRIRYIQGAGSQSARVDGVTLFEAILSSGESDDQTHIVWRGDTCFALLNAYPYTSGHLLVLPKRGVAELDELTDTEHSELWEGVRMSVHAVRAAYSPDGVSIGANLGQGAGAGVPDHLHVHVVPRWMGDTNFMTSVANVRVMPEALTDSWKRIVDSWPE